MAGQVRIGVGEHGRGMFAARDMQPAWRAPSQEVLSLPFLDALCVPTDVQAAPWYPGYLHSWQRHHGTPLPAPLASLLLDGAAAPSARLAAWLLHSLRAAPRFGAYGAQLLDRRQRLSMVRAAPQHLEALGDPALAAAVSDMQRRVAAECAQLRARLGPQLVGGDGGDTDDLLWAFDLVKSRTFCCSDPAAAAAVAAQSPGRGSGGGPVPPDGTALNLLCPWADLANHCVLGPNCGFGIVAAGDGAPGGTRHVQGAGSAHPSMGGTAQPSGGWRFVVRPLATAGALQTGSEVLVSYGQLDNRQLVSSYGFVSPGNPHDRLPADWLGPAGGAALRPQLLARAADTLADAWAAAGDEAAQRRAYTALASLVGGRAGASGPAGSSADPLAGEAAAVRRMLGSIRGRLAAAAAPPAPAGAGIPAAGAGQRSTGSLSGSTGGGLLAAAHAYAAERRLLAAAAGDLLEVWLQQNGAPAAPQMRRALETSSSWGAARVAV